MPQTQEQQVDAPEFTTKINKLEQIAWTAKYDLMAIEKDKLDPQYQKDYLRAVELFREAKLKKLPCPSEAVKVLASIDEFRSKARTC